MSPQSDLNASLLDAHASSDGAKLAGLYQQAGQQALDQGAEDRGCFFLTHAYIFALEAGLPQANDIHAVLKSHGRESD